jgi:hypothetical protein
MLTLNSVVLTKSHKIKALGLKYCISVREYSLFKQNAMEEVVNTHVKENNLVHEQLYQMMLQNPVEGDKSLLKAINNRYTLELPEQLKYRLKGFNIKSLVILAFKQHPFTMGLKLIDTKANIARYNSDLTELDIWPFLYRHFPKHSFVLFKGIVMKTVKSPDNFWEEYNAIPEDIPQSRKEGFLLRRVLIPEWIYYINVASKRPIQPRDWVVYGKINPRLSVTDARRFFSAYYPQHYEIFIALESTNGVLCKSPHSHDKLMKAFWELYSGVGLKPLEIEI